MTLLRTAARKTTQYLLLHCRRGPRRFLAVGLIHCPFFCVWLDPPCPLGLENNIERRESLLVGIDPYHVHLVAEEFLQKRYGQRFAEATDLQEDRFIILRLNRGKHGAVQVQAAVQLGKEDKGDFPIMMEQYEE